MPRCEWYPRDDKNAPECPYPTTRGACVWCTKFPKIGRVYDHAAAMGTADQQDEHFMASYCPALADD